MLKKIRASTMVEVLIAVSIFSVFSTGVFYLSVNVVDSDKRTEDSNKALYYAQEGIEAARQMRDKNFLSLTGGDHGLQLSSDVWSFIPAPEDIDGYYSRTVSVDDVYRGDNGDIAATGVLDPNIKKITSSVTWDHLGVLPKNVKLNTYLSNWPGHDFLQTDCAEFDSGTYDGTTVEFTAAPPENNCALKLDLVEEAGSFYSYANIGEHGRDVLVDGNYAYVASHKQNQGLAVVNITDRLHPFVAKYVDVGSDAMSIAKIGNYVFVAVNNESRGLAVVNVTNPASATLVTQTNIGGSGVTITASGNTLFMGIHSGWFNKFITIDATTPTNPSILWWGVILYQLYDVSVVNDYAYWATDDDWQSLQIYDVTRLAHPRLISSIAAGEEINAVEVRGPYAFLGTENHLDPFLVVDISDPAHPYIAAHNLNIDEEVQDIVLQGDYAYAALNDNNKNLAAINISTPTSPYLAYTSDVGGKGTGIAADENYIYETLDVGNKGLAIIGTAVHEVLNSGTYISAPYDTGSDDTRYNFIAWQTTPVPGSTVKFQIKTATTQAGLASATFVGSDGTASTYYETSMTPIVTAPSAGLRFLQFKIFIDSDGTSSPSVESVTINYTP